MELEVQQLEAKAAECRKLARNAKKGHRDFTARQLNGQAKLYAVRAKAGRELLAKGWK